MKKNLIFLAILSITITAFAYVRKPIYTSATAYIETAQVVTAANGTVTNTFGITYASAPKVIVCGFGATTSGTNYVQSVTTSNCVINARDSGVTNNLIVVGTPQ